MAKKDKNSKKDNKEKKLLKALKKAEKMLKKAEKRIKELEIEKSAKSAKATTDFKEKVTKQKVVATAQKSTPAKSPTVAKKTVAKTTAPAKRAVVKRTVAKPGARTASTTAAKSSTFNVRIAVGKIRQMETVTEIRNFIKGDDRVTIKEAAEIRFKTIKK